MNNKRWLVPVLVTAIAVASALVASSGTAGGSGTTSTSTTTVTQAPKRADVVLVRRLRSNVWRWQAVMGLHRSRSGAAPHTVRALRFWRVQERRIRRLAGHPPHRSGWLCIHRYEGGWRDSGDPYWGGLQMDRGFMRNYAPRVLLRRGWADQWSSLEQMWVAERAHRSGRGYWPWPNTARLCGLL